MKEEKKPIKINLSTLIIVIALIVIAIMGYFIYTFYSEKIEETEKSEELQAKLDTLNNTVNDLQKNMNASANTVNSNQASSNTINANNAAFTDEQVRQAVSDYLGLKTYADCGTPLDFLAEKGIINYNPDQYSINTNTGEITENVKFSDYKKAMLNYVTEEEFTRNWIANAGVGESSNGYVTHGQLGGGRVMYTIVSITKTNENEYSVKTTSTIEGSYNNGENNYTFTVKSNNGKCVIDSFK